MALSKWEEVSSQGEWPTANGEMDTIITWKRRIQGGYLFFIETGTYGQSNLVFVPDSERVESRGLDV